MWVLLCQNPSMNRAAFFLRGSRESFLGNLASRDYPISLAFCPFFHFKTHHHRISDPSVTTSRCWSHPGKIFACKNAHDYIRPADDWYVILRTMVTLITSADCFSGLFCFLIHLKDTCSQVWELWYGLGGRAFLCLLPATVHPSLLKIHVYPR